MDKKKEGKLALGYALVGVVNTLITIGVYELLLYVHTPVDLANFLSYAAGIVNSYVCNKVFVFKQKGAWLSQGLRFFGGALLCWGLQWLAFTALRYITNEHWAYFLAMPVYPVANYLNNRFIIVKPSRR